MSSSKKYRSDWCCYQCGFVNFVKNKECKKCHFGFRQDAFDNIINQMEANKKKPLHVLFPYDTSETPETLPLRSAKEETKRKFLEIFRMNDSSDDTDEDDEPKEERKADDKPKQERKGVRNEDDKPTAETRATKLGLLMDIREMVTEDIPLPLEHQNEEHKDYVRTSDKYSSPTNNSPMFGVDCEFVFTASGNEIAEVSLVDEDHQLVLYFLVKPNNRILNYLTQYSRLTPRRLADITTRLADVQQAIRKALPPDAILVGHDVGHDLKALKMFHPHIIDSSCIYKLYSDPSKKSKLQLLSKMFLNEEVQVKSHDPTEDSVASLKLVQHKLLHGMSYGNVVYGGKLPVETLNEREQTAEGKRLHFFRQIEEKRKTVCIVCRSDHSSAYSDSWTDSSTGVNFTKMVPCTSNKAVSRSTVRHASSHNFTICHMDVSTTNMDKDIINTRHVLRKLDKRIHRVYTGCAANALVILALGGRAHNHGAAFLTIKDNRI